MTFHPAGAADRRDMPILQQLAVPSRSIASILAEMDVLDYMERRFIAEVHEDFVGKLASSEIDTEVKKQKHPQRLRGGAFC